jgi:predicted amidohydrolase
MPDHDRPAIHVAAIQMDAQVGAVEANLARAAGLVEQAAAQKAQLIVLPELFSTGYEYSDNNYELPEPLDGRTGSWIAGTAQRLGVHLVGSFPARMTGRAYIVALLAAPDGRQWVYRKMHVAFWENCYFERGNEPVIADTDLGRIGLLICWDEIFSDLARAYQGQVDLVCIPSSPPTYLGTLEDEQGKVLAEIGGLRSLGSELDGVDWFTRAQEAHARSAGVPVVYAARCGEFHSRLPFGSSFLLALPPGDALRVLRAAGGRYRLRCPLMGRSCILDARGERLTSAGQEGEAVLVARVQPGAPDQVELPPLPKGRALVPGIPASQLLYDDSLVAGGRWYRLRHAPK